MITNSDITVYNRISGDSTHYDTWNRTVLHGVHVHVDHKTAVTDNGLKVRRSTKSGFLRIFRKQGSIFRRISSPAVAVMDTGPYRMMIRLSWESVRLQLKSLQI